MMARWSLLALAAVPALALVMPPGIAGAQRDTAKSASMAEGRAALRAAVAAHRAAQSRSEAFERQAAEANDAAERSAREAAALAANIQQAEAGAAAAEARLALAARERAVLREMLGREQQPLVEVTAALQQFVRRPVALSVLRPGSVRDTVYLQAMLDGAMPHVERRTADLRGQIARSRELGQTAQAAARTLRAEEAVLKERRAELALREQRQRLASSSARGTATREAERAMALAERARDLEGLVSDLDRAALLRQRLAALPGPLLRPSRPEEARMSVAAPAPAVTQRAAAPPSPYLLPVTGRVVTGFGAPVEGGTASGLTLAPRASAQVVAPAAGRVAFAGPYRGYGRIVIIEHAGGWVSLVTGLARSDVAIGEQLVAGAPLGIAGARDPEITVELRRAGQVLNPLRFVG